MPRFLKPALVATSVVFACICSTASTEGEIPWTEKISGALKSSSAVAKPVFIDIWATWCVPCKEMDDTTYRDPAIVAAMEHFVPLKVDQDSSEMFCERHQVEGLPMVLYLDGEGREIGRRMGLQKTESLLESMNAVKDGYTDYLKAMEDAKSPESASVVASYLNQAGNPGGAIEILRRALKAAGGSVHADGLAVQLAEAQLASGDAKAASNAFQRLSDSATDDAVRGRALYGLFEAQRERGRDDEAAQTLARLESEFPDLALKAEAK
jgi:thioredoxin-like negative regulator of GroEL